MITSTVRPTTGATMTIGHTTGATLSVGPYAAPTSYPEIGRYQGQPVTHMRDAAAGDVGLDQGKKQVMIRVAGGSEQIALRSDVKP